MELIEKTAQYEKELQKYESDYRTSIQTEYNMTFHIEELNEIVLIREQTIEGLEVMNNNFKD